MPAKLGLSAYSARCSSYLGLHMTNSSSHSWLLMAVLVLGGCSRGQTYDPDQVRTTRDTNGTPFQHLMLPIKGKPFASGAQWVYDQLVASQPGGDIQGILVDPASVVVVASQLGFGQGIFIVTGQAKVTLTHGRGEFEAHFRECLQGGCLDDRVSLLAQPATCRRIRLTRCRSMLGNRRSPQPIRPMPTTALPRSSQFFCWSTRLPLQAQLIRQSSIAGCERIR